MDSPATPPLKKTRLHPNRATTVALTARSRDILDRYRARLASIALATAERPDLLSRDRAIDALLAAISAERPDWFNP